MAKGRRFTFTVEPDLYEPLKDQARRERRSVGSLINWLIAQYLEQQQGVNAESTIQHGGDRKSVQRGDKVQRPHPEEGGD